MSEHFSSAAIIHPPHTSGISRCWLVGVDIAHLSLRLATVKGQSETRSFALLGGVWEWGGVWEGGGGIWSDHHLPHTSSLHRAAQGGGIHPLIQIIPNTLRLTSPGGDTGHAGTGMFSASWSVYTSLQHGAVCHPAAVMRWESWMDVTTGALRISSPQPHQKTSTPLTHTRV